MREGKLNQRNIEAKNNKKRANRRPIWKRARARCSKGIECGQLFGMEAKRRKKRAENKFNRTKIVVGSVKVRWIEAKAQMIETRWWYLIMARRECGCDGHWNKKPIDYISIGYNFINVLLFFFFFSFISSFLSLHPSIDSRNTFQLRININCCCSWIFSLFSICA